jgi:hypothetical protein
MTGGGLVKCRWCGGDQPPGLDVRVRARAAPDGVLPFLASSRLAINCMTRCPRQVESQIGVVVSEFPESPSVAT